MTWTLDKFQLSRRLMHGGRVIAWFDIRATELECEIVRDALLTVEKLQNKEAELSGIKGTLQQREARLQEVESKLAATEETVKYLELNPPKGNTNA